MVEYATWTQTTIDDHIAAIVVRILTDHRSSLESIIDTLRAGRELSPVQLSTLLKVESISQSEVSSPMTTLYIISMIYHVLLYLQQSNNTKPDVDPLPSRRPVINFVRNIFNKNR
jgi:hypothetical protein